MKSRNELPGWKMHIGNGSSGGLSECVGILRQAPGVTRLNMPAGQILIYAGHIPMGLYLALKGAIEIRTSETLQDDSAVRILDAKKGIFLFPEYTSIHTPLAFTATIKRKAELLFLPRSLILGDQQIRKILEVI
jgi:hypothetical protein